MEKRKNNITIAVSDCEYKKLKAKADKERRPLAQFVWLVISDYLEGKK